MTAKKNSTRNSKVKKRKLDGNLKLWSKQNLLLLIFFPTDILCLLKSIDVCVLTQQPNFLVFMSFKEILELVGPSKSLKSRWKFNAKQTELNCWIELQDFIVLIERISLLDCIFK